MNAICMGLWLYQLPYELDTLFDSLGTWDTLEFWSWNESIFRKVQALVQLP